MSTHQIIGLSIILGLCLLLWLVNRGPHTTGSTGPDSGWGHRVPVPPRAIQPPARPTPLTRVHAEMPPCQPPAPLDPRELIVCNAAEVLLARGETLLGARVVLWGQGNHDEHLTRDLLAFIHRNSTAKPKTLNHGGAL